MAVILCSDAYMANIKLLFFCFMLVSRKLYGPHCYSIAILKLNEINEIVWNVCMWMCRVQKLNERRLKLWNDPYMSKVISITCMTCILCCHIYMSHQKVHLSSSTLLTPAPGVHSSFTNWILSFVLNRLRHVRLEWNWNPSYEMKYCNECRKQSN